jgi:ABC-2 type transport system ATP-binding protein
LERFQLDPSKKSRTYSKGNRQKVALVAAFACDAELYLLDEPTSGLDPLMEQTFRACVRELTKQGKTVFLSSHILSEVESLCDKMAVIRQGVIVDSGSLADMRHLTRTSVAVKTEKPITDLGVSGIYDMRQEGGDWRFMAESSAIGKVMEALTPLGIQSITVTPPSLEELFMRHYDTGGGGSQ